jgi:hypothetical protein
MRLWPTPRPRLGVFTVGVGGGGSGRTESDGSCGAGESATVEVGAGLGPTVLEAVVGGGAESERAAGSSEQPASIPVSISAVQAERHLRGAGGLDKEPLPFVDLGSRPGRRGLSWQ